jgi:hypothetical protein
MDNDLVFVDFLKVYKQKTIAGNKEYYEILEYIDDKIINHGGSTFPYEQEFSDEISEESANDKLRSYFIDKCDTFSLEVPEDSQQWKKFLEENWNL